MLPAEKGVGLAQDEQGGDPSATKPIGQHSYEMGCWRLKHKMENPLVRQSRLNVRTEGIVNLRIAP